MAMRLALACGQYDVDSMLDDMTPQQMDEWLAYYYADPLVNPGGATPHKPMTVEQQQNVLAAKYGNNRNTRG